MKRTFLHNSRIITTEDDVKDLLARGISSMNRVKPHPIFSVYPLVLNGGLTIKDAVRLVKTEANYITLVKVQLTSKDCIPVYVEYGVIYPRMYIQVSKDRVVEI